MATPPYGTVLYHVDSLATYDLLKLYTLGWMTVVVSGIVGRIRKEPPYTASASEVCSS